VGQDETGPSRQRLGAGRGSEAGRRGTDKWGRQHSAPDSIFKPNQVYFKPIQKVLSLVRKIGSKIWMERVEIRNNFPYRNFSILEKGFELKCRELQWVEIHWKILELSILMKFGQQAPGYTLFQGKINFHQRGVIILISTRKGNSDWFHDSLNLKLYFWIPSFDLGSY
jgi:hypothetical protein